MKIYTLKNCDTCRKAIKWLNGKGIAYENHDVRADGLTADDVGLLMEAVGWEVLLNRRSTTWRGLSDSQKSDIDDVKAEALIVEHPTLMKRPVFVRADSIDVGFTAGIQKELST